MMSRVSDEAFYNLRVANVYLAAVLWREARERLVAMNVTDAGYKDAFNELAEAEHKIVRALRGDA